MKLFITVLAIFAVANAAPVVEELTEAEKRSKIQVQVLPPSFVAYM